MERDYTKNRIKVGIIIMVVELSFKDFQLSRKLFQNLEKYILGITSVFEGNSTGRIFVNNMKNPTIAIMYFGKSSLIFVGDSKDISFNQSLKILFQETFIPLIEKKSENNSFSIYCKKEWKEKITSFYNNLQPIRRRFYQLKELRLIDWRDKLPDDFSIKFINKNLLSNKKLEKIEPMLSWIKGCWISEKNFLKKGFGFCILHNKLEIASVCLTNYYSENQNRCEIGIYTEEKFQKQGLAKILTSEMVDYCLNRNIKCIEWHTREETVASVKIAESIGFELRKEFVVLQGFIGELKSFL